MWLLHGRADRHSFRRRNPEGPCFCRLLSDEDKMMYAFRENGQPLEWHFFPFGGHGYVDPGAPGYQAHTDDLSWPLVADFMERHLKWDSPSFLE